MALPSREFYEQNPRSALLRNICIQAVISSEIIVLNADATHSAVADLLDINQRLSNLGIEPEMHTIARDDPDAKQKRKQLSTDPVRTAEWLAGQVRSGIIERSAFTTGDPTGLSEHDRLHEFPDAPQLIDLRHLGPKATNFVRNFQTIQAIDLFLDRESGPSDVSHID